MSELDEILETRRNFYAFLFRMYVEAPARELAADLVNGKFQFEEFKSLDVNTELFEGFRLLNEFMEKSKGRDIDALYDELVSEYTLLFVGPFRPPVEPYEAWWVSGKRMGESLVAVKQAYRKAGVAKSREYKDLEDHIGFELKFMHYLCEEELAAATQKRLIECLKLQRAFLDEHMLKWVPTFCDALFTYEKADFFKGIAKLTKGFILFDDAVVSDLLESVQ